MANSINLAQMVLEANYTSMSYQQLIELEMTFSWANQIINSILPVKKQEAMNALGKKFNTKVNADIQSISVPAPKESNPKADKKSDVDLVIEAAKKTSVVKGVDPSAPYYMCWRFKKSEDGEFLPFGDPSASGHNLNAEVLKKLKIAEKGHLENDFKNVRTTPRGDYMVYRMEGGEYRVSYYKMTGGEIKYDPAVIEKAREILKPFTWAFSDEDMENMEKVFKDAERTEKIVKNDKTKTSKKDTRRLTIVGTKDGETRKWNSMRECERDLGVSPGTASQVVAGKMKSAKGWKLYKQE